MDATIFIVTISTIISAIISSPVPNTNAEYNPENELTVLSSLNPSDQVQAIEELSLENAAENLNPEEYDFKSPKDGETMHTAENIVFRPLFSYRRIHEKRQRLYGSRKKSSTTYSPNTVRRSQAVYYSQPPRYIYPYQGYPTYYNRNGGYYYPITQ